jgi:hypothetical protein
MGHNRRNRSDDPPSQVVLRWPTERARKWTGEFLNSVPDNDSVLAVIAIGSAVRPHVVSTDLDLIVVSAKTTAVHISPPMEVDLRVYSVATIDSQIASGHALLGSAIKFGKALFQRDHSWDRIADSWKDRLPLPSAALARERALTAYERLAKILESGDTDAIHEQAVSYLTQLARAELLARGVYPASRPELAVQLRATNGNQIAEQLDRLLQNDRIDKGRIDQVLKLTA